MMTRARFSKATCSWKSAWVPTTSIGWPLWMLSSAVCRALAVTVPDNQASGTSSGVSQLRKFAMCCSASSSVGAMKAA